MGLPGGPRQNMNMMAGRPGAMMGGGQAPWFAGNRAPWGGGQMMGPRGAGGVMGPAARGMGPYGPMEDYGHQNRGGAGRGRGMQPSMATSSVAAAAKLDASSLANADPTQQKQMIG